MGERLNRTQEVVGSIPISSTNQRNHEADPQRAGLFREAPAIDAKVPLTNQDFLMHIAAMRQRARLSSDASVTRLARFFHALSDETRLRIIGRLLQGEQCVCDLTAMLGAAQSRLSFHMKTLKDAGLVSDRREGRWIHYAVVPGSVAEIREFLSFVEERAARCCG